MIRKLLAYIFIRMIGRRERIAYLIDILMYFVAQEKTLNAKVRFEYGQPTVFLIGKKEEVEWVFDLVQKEEKFLGSK